MTLRPDPCDKSCIIPGMKVEIILKQDQRSGRRTKGIVQEILTGSRFHPHGIKVRLTDGRIGRVAGFTGLETAQGDPATR